MNFSADISFQNVSAVPNEVQYVRIRMVVATFRGVGPVSRFTGVKVRHMGPKIRFFHDPYMKFQFFLFYAALPGAMHLERCIRDIM